MGVFKSIFFFWMFVSIAFLASLYVDDPELDMKTKMFNLMMKYVIVPYLTSLDFSDPFFDIPYKEDNMMSVSVHDEFINGVRTLDLSVLSEDGDFVIPFRVFEPEGRVGKLPVVVWSHGGGFVLGRYNDHSCHAVCEWLVKEANVICVSVEYRLAPRHAWTKGKEDGYSVLKYILNGGIDIIDTEQVFVAGESAGATIALTSSMFMNDKDKVLPIAGLVLVYPVLTHGHNSEVNKYMLSHELVKLFVDAIAVNPTVDEYIDTISETNPYNFTGFPKTIIISAEYDRILLTSVKLESALKKHNVEVDRHHYIDIHGFFNLGYSKNTPAAKQKVLEFLQQK